MDAEILYRECPRCHGKTGVQYKYCVHCSLNLEKLDLDVLNNPNSLQKTEKTMAHEFKIAMWGPRTSGKTTYVTAVYNTTSDDDPGHQWDIQLDDLESMNTIMEMSDNMRSWGEFPPLTDPASNPINYNFLFLPSEKAVSKESSTSFLERMSKWIGEVPSDMKSGEIGKVGLRVTFTDVAGERYTSDLERNQEVWSRLVEADGLICLLDPASPLDHFSATDKLLNRLKYKLTQSAPERLVQERIPHYIAFCFSKIDNEQFYQFQDSPEQVIDLLKKTSGQNVRRKLENYAIASRIRFFCISSVGVDENKKTRVGKILKLNHETGEPIIDGDGKSIEITGVIAPHEIKAIHILDPLEWLFAQSLIDIKKYR
ncbi:MAG: hypothetical protein EYC68_22190 [Chloroflexota bacterium]|nr:MAG: hypothetical protein EYC68_22190 [Chloroflexota bacterium]